MARTRSLYARGTIPREVRAHVWSFTWGHCWYCGTNYLNPFENLAIEHVIPVCRGGTDDIENLVPSCVDCNQAKGTMLLEEWRRARPRGDDPDEYPHLREFVPDRETGDAVLTGRFWFERDPFWQSMRVGEIQTYHRIQRMKREGRW